MNKLTINNAIQKCEKPSKLCTCISKDKSHSIQPLPILEKQQAEQHFCHREKPFQTLGQWMAECNQFWT
jgi:hypothetical protein